ncbi:hypothetical protein [Chryseobacterium taklimakanense]|uniref:Lipoprotein n=1 Tax=Chryseobacterium taklimakanense TaxID=536441 RepID=A0A3G8WHX4_9FLAO|nr:hypothetical protein [Chryseobacterium taklimakanense]AZI20780.1 hypothetical protein EIH08_08745 [Chryseobacterium taklimakanense]
MKKLIALFLITILAACNSHKVFDNYELSYSKSGGFAPIYENMLIKGNTVNYFLKARVKNTAKKVRLPTLKSRNFMT